MGKFGPTYMSTSQVINLIVIVIVCIPLLIFNEWLKETTGLPIWIWVLIIIIGVWLIRELIFDIMDFSIERKRKEFNHIDYINKMFKDFIIPLIATALVVGASYLLLISVL